jgi:C-terminal processing protease CtpA/Prc
MVESPARVTAVVPCSPAHRAGVQPNDLILTVNGEDTRERPPFRIATPGTRYEIILQRGADTISTALTIGPPAHDRDPALTTPPIPGAEALGCSAPE